MIARSHRGAAHSTAPASLRALVAWAGVAVGCALLFALTGGDAAAQGEPADGADALTRGEMLYSVNCAGCHGGDGRGGETVAGLAVPALAGTERVTIAYMRLVMDTGRMPPAGDPQDNRVRREPVTPEERDAILAWTTETFGLSGDVPPPPEGDVAEGLRVYAANCSSCHGATGAGGVAGGGAWTPRVNDVSPQTLADAIRTGPFQMPRFDETQIGQQEMGDVSAFLHAVREEGGTLLFPGELNPVFASGFGAGLAAAIVLALVVIAGRPTMFPDPDPDPDPDAAAEPRGEEERS